MDKEYKIFLTICLILLFVAGMMIFFGEFSAKKREDIIYPNKYLQQKYLKEASNYLREKYNREFKLSLYHDGYKKNYIEIDGSSFRFGRDRGVKQYVYEVSTEYPFTSYVTVWIYFTSNEVKIHEGNGEMDVKDDTSFEELYEQYLKK